MAPMFPDDGSSSVTSSPLQYFPMISHSPGLGSPRPWLKELKSEERGLYLIHMLLTCANHVANGNLEIANITLDHISQLASPNGDTMQRIASYFTEALANRILKSWRGLYMALNSTRISLPHEEILVQKLFLDLFPFLKVAYVVTNQSIMEAMEDEKMVHVIDLNSEEPAQWIALLQGMSARPGGPPHLRITGIHQQKEVLDQTARKLSEEAERLDIPFQFDAVVSKLEDLDVKNLRVKTGEALAISSILQLHTLLTSDDGSLQKTCPPGFKNTNGLNLQRVLQNQNTIGELLEKDSGNGYSGSPDSASSSPLSGNGSVKMDDFLNGLWGLSPKVMVMMEQNSNHNGQTLMERLTEALHFYASLFDCLEYTMLRTSPERLKVEKMRFGNEIKNIIACEGSERKERHEKLEKWVQRLEFAGFGNVPLSFHSMLQAKRLIDAYGCNGYRLKEEKSSVVICWQDRALFSISAWRSRRSIGDRRNVPQRVFRPGRDTAATLKA